MAFQSGLFDSTEVEIMPGGMVVGNKAQNAAFFAKYFSSFIGDGVFQEEKGIAHQALSTPDALSFVQSCFPVPLFGANHAKNAVVKRFILCSRFPPWCSVRSHSHRRFFPFFFPL